MRPEDMASDQKLNKAVVHVVKEQEGGMPAPDVVQTVSKVENVSEKQVQRAVRTLLDRGELVVGAKLNLFASEK